MVTPMIESFRRIARNQTLAVVTLCAFAAPAFAQSALTGPSIGAPQFSSPGQSAAPSSGGAGLTSQQGCQADVAKLQTARMSAVEGLNKIAKANKGKLDANAACPRFRQLVKAEQAFKAYLVTNKDWCNVPDSVIDTVTQSAAKDGAMSVKACQIAVEMKKAQAQAALGLQAQAPKLPAGPL